ncbi:Hypothetical predicted protein [Paramuricea clavata]|uniref:Uncharacterized protein n=1 Tax=Paramuricea clavata TaxID=317549 RepID=A0A7D9J149_PARCT|nr:Hypothetical predicted protein [Paramuricea clavata]
MTFVTGLIAPIKCELHNINPHTFVIKKNEAGKIVLRYKHWSGDTEWLPSKDACDGIEILKEDLSVLKDVPSLLSSSPDKVDLEHLRRDIPKFLKNSRVINDEQKEWWQTFFEKADEMYMWPGHNRFVKTV